MNDPFPFLGDRLKALRKDRSLSLAAASDLCNVSKTMLGQIERGESTPSITTLWKIAGGFKVSFASLLADDSDRYLQVAIGQEEVLTEADGAVRLCPVFPFAPETGFDYFYVTMAPGTGYTSTAHPNARYEHIIVTQGTLTLICHGQPHRLKAPTGFRFVPSGSHQYINETEETLVFQDIMSY
ncbi:helix-turn-helix domain-containing protein [Peptococcus simiae]|uniref:Helix-turn-helix domain-containing protein n=1 Tax=Peptococcus simiae TaxID=1643805 RepID=A0ABW9GYI7_9FIRM